MRIALPFRITEKAKSAKFILSKYLLLRISSRAYVYVYVRIRACEYIVAIYNYYLIFNLSTAREERTWV